MAQFNLENDLNNLLRIVTPTSRVAPRLQKSVLHSSRMRNSSTSKDTSSSSSTKTPSKTPKQNTPGGFILYMKTVTNSVCSSILICILS